MMVPYREPELHQLACSMISLYKSYFRELFKDVCPGAPPGVGRVMRDNRIRELAMRVHTAGIAEGVNVEVSDLGNASVTLRWGSDEIRFVVPVGG